MKILTVDDEIGICEQIKDTFSKTGYEVLMALNGKEALSIVRKEKPKIVFLDIRMEGMDGLEVLRQIKEVDPSIKVIMLSIADDPDTQNKAKLLGASGFVRKPFFDRGLIDEVIMKVNQMAKEREPARMLIVDDEEGIRASLKDFLTKRFECDVVEAANGQQAIDLLRKEKFDLLFLDIRMPGISGMDVIKEKKKLDYKPAIWVITHFDSEEVAHKVIKEGADDYIPKPFSLRLLDKKIRNFLVSIGKYKPKGSADSGK
ncbi:MAG: response regulator [Candidatus Omnitrophica bacterium]|nr:response regulator [Candidatus Omnitrophota bacterium]